MKYLTPLRRHLCFLKSMTYHQNCFVTETTNRQIVEEIACALIKSIYQCTPSSKLYWSMKVRNELQVTFTDNTWSLLKLYWFWLFFFFSSTTELESSVPFTRLLVQRDWYGKVARQERQENQLETRTRLGSKRSFGQALQFTTS